MSEERRQRAMQRAASLMALPPLLEELGVELAAVLKGTGVSSHELGPDTFIPYAAFLSILDNACRLTGRGDIGLLLGRRQTLSALGPLGDVMRHAATLGDAIADFVALQSSNSTGGAVYLMRADGDVILGYGVYDAAAQVSSQIYDLVLAVGCNLIAELTEGAAGPEEILLSRASPGNLSAYQRMCRCPVRFGQNQTGLLLRAGTLALPLSGANSDLHDLALARLVSARSGTAMQMSGHIRHLLRPLLMNGRAGANEVAERLRIHPRAMRRRLHREGTTFERLKDEVRYAAARELLLLGNLSVGDISATLDYSNSSAFVHAFRRWSGTSPGRWRDGRSAVRLVSS